MNMTTPQREPDPVTFRISIVRDDPATGARDEIYVDGYGLLHELLEDVIEMANKRHWIEEVPLL